MMGALRSGDEFAPADLTNQLRLPPYVAPVQIQAIAMGITARGGLAVELTQQDEGERLHHRRGRARKQVRDPDVEPPILQSDEAVGVGEAAELDPQLRHRRPRLDFAENAAIDLLGCLEEERALNPIEVERASR